MYEDLGGDKGQLSVNDFLVQVWVNYKIEDGFKLKDLLRHIPKEQAWLKRDYIKALIGKPCVDLTPIKEALSNCEPPTREEMEYIQQHSPIRGTGNIVNR